MLRALESSGSASVAELAAATELHENTVRGHLERLRDDGYVRHETAPASGRGRPEQRWRPVPPESLGPYAGLAVALADALSSSGADAAGAARAAGSRWGAQLAGDRPDESDPRALLLEVMREQGFAPAETAGEAGGSIALHRCPLLAAAAHRSEVVCAVHEGMIEGIVGARSPGARARLLPFAADGACLLRLRVSP